MTNPLLDTNQLPQFNTIKTEHIIPAIEQAIAQNRDILQTCLTTAPSWQTLISPLEQSDEHLSRVWSPVSHLNSVMNSAELREAYNQALPLLTAWHTEVAQNLDLYQAFCTLRDSAEYPQLTPPQQRLITQSIQGFELSGVALPAADKQRYADIMQEMAKLTATFEQNLLDSTQAWTKHITDPTELQGLPETSLAMAADAAQRKKLTGWLLTLEFPSYYGVATYAHNRALREELYRAYAARASEIGPNAGTWDNGPVMQKIMELRQESAALLGFANYAESSLATKMADTPTEVQAFLLDLAKHSRPMAEQDVAAITAFAAKTDNITDLNPWDIGYYSEKLRQDKYALSDEMLRPYFQAEKVLDGLFAIVGKLYGLNITAQTDLETWHDDVRFFTVHDQQNNIRGQFYLDLYARENKRGGAWMDVCRAKLGNQIPVAYLTCNAAPPAGGKPALMTHDEVVTLFHEFGHGLHHMLTQVSWPSVGGISGVEWDAVELPSQFLENWAWEQEALDLFAKHYETNEPLPAELFNKMQAAKNYQSGMQMLRQVEFSLFDMQIHIDVDAASKIQEILNQIRSQVAVLKAPEFNRFQHSFAHIFAGGYCAGYYSYKWAEVLSADAFAAFEEEGIFNRATGLRFMENILERGASEPAAQLFENFRGRKPDIAALLRHSGISAAA